MVGFYLWAELADSIVINLVLQNVTFIVVDDLQSTQTLTRVISSFQWMGLNLT